VKGITSYGVYIPRFRLDRAAIAGVLRSPSGKGTRSVASYDEDTTSMGVEAARLAVEPESAPEGVLLATPEPAYLDKTNATTIHAALGLDASATAYDMVGSVRSGIGALRGAIDAAHNGQRTLAVLADLRTGLPGSSDESQGGDGAAAFVCGGGSAIAELVAAGSATADVLERSRVPGDRRSRVWEERFGESVYLPLVQSAVADASKQAGIAVTDADHLIVSGLHARAARQAKQMLGAPAEALARDFSASIGNLGCAQPGVLLADTLDRAKPGAIVFLVSLADGVDVLVLRTTGALVEYRNGREPVRSQIDSSASAVDYGTFLTWREMLEREPPRRPEFDAPTPPPSYRSEGWKLGFTGTRCVSCGTKHLPPNRVCASCRSVDQMAPERFSDVPATITTYTVDYLAFSLSPPVIDAVIDFEGGGRFQCEMTDVDPTAVHIGDRVEMTFRRLYTANGVHNYFWKARPVRTDTRGDH
jgi:hydroxymethylglutaryl-CoA synthase